MIALGAALLAAAAWLALPIPIERRLASVTRHGDAAAAVDAARSVRPRRHGGAALVLLASAVLGLALWLLVGGFVGPLAAVTCVLLLPRLVGRLEPRAARARREGLERQAPLLADLLSATLASGATLRSALGAVVPAVGEPTASALRPVLAAIDLGADPVVAWRSARPVGLLADPHADIVAAVVRAAESGAPLSRVLARMADDLRRRQRATVEVAARSAGVRAVAPLAACFLPAFLLLGVVPVVASLAGALL